MQCNKLGLVLILSFTMGCSLFRRAEEKPSPEPEKQVAAAEKEQAPVAPEPESPPATNTQEPEKEPTPKKIHHEHEWSYVGAKGPEFWGELKPEYSACKSGQRQSPIDLRWNKPRPSGQIEFNYKPSKISTIDNGHTYQITFDPGGTATIRGKTYELLQLHFHSASEHTIAGNSLPLEAHFVHKNSNGELAVLGIIMVEGQRNEALQRLWESLPHEENESVSPADVVVDPRDLMPKVLTYYNYSGSLTTPPCTEGVDWNVFNTPVSLARDQILTFRAKYPHNNRPIQPGNGRKVTNY